MKPTRRKALQTAIAAAASLPIVSLSGPISDPEPSTRTYGAWGASEHQGRHPLPTFGSTPVVGDGKWIWTKPPEKDRGYLEPRYFDVTTEIKTTGRGSARNLIATTVLPSEFPEQSIVGDKAGKLEGNASAVRVQPLVDGARQLLMSVDRIENGQVNVARSTLRVKLSKSYFGFKRDQFPIDQSAGVRRAKPWLANSPGIRIRSAAISKIVSMVKEAHSHPWDRAIEFQKWVFKNIKGRPQVYTSVDAAIKKGVGDCEERACTFIALCRNAGVPARLVWVPSHCWAEILLIDTKGVLNWIPVHTAGYSWFGWTGVHEVVLQKGDSIPNLQSRKKIRLVSDYYRCQGRKPTIEYTASIKPLAIEKGTDVGPGERRKKTDGRWELVQRHKADKFHRKD